MIESVDMSYDRFVHVCPKCGTRRTYNTSAITMEWVEEFKEFRNLHLDCACGTIEVLNMNLPLTEPSLYSQLDTQRDMIKQILLLVRADLKGV